MNPEEEGRYSRRWLMKTAGIAGLASSLSLPAARSDGAETIPTAGRKSLEELTGESLDDAVSVSMIEDGDDLRFALTAAQGQGGPEETVTGELRLATIDDKTFASARIEGTADWITLMVSDPDTPEVTFRLIADAAIEQAVAAQVISGTAQNTALGARGLFIHEDSEGLTRFLSENPKAFDGGAEAVMRRVDAGAGDAARDDAGADANEAEAGQAEAPAGPQSPLVRALLGTLAGVLIVSMLMVAFSSQGRRRR